MRLYKRERSPYWWAEMTVDGKAHRFSTKRPISDKKGAQRFMADEYARLSNAAQFGAKPEITLEEAMALTIRTVKGATKESYTLARNRMLGLGYYEGLGRFTLDGAKKLHNLRQQDIDDLVEARLAEGLAANTVILEVDFLKRVNNHAKRRYMVNADLEWRKPKKFKKTRWLTDQEEEVILARLLAKDKPDHIKAHDLFVFLVDTGVRISEALSARWADINMTSLCIEVYRPKTDILSVVPISDRLAAVLKRLHNQERPFMDMTNAVYILRRIIHEECDKDENIVKTRGAATIHTLRDTFASRMVKRGMSLHKVSKLLGHTSTAMTAKYAQLEAQDVVAEARKLLNAAA